MCLLNTSFQEEHNATSSDFNNLNGLNFFYVFFFVCYSALYAPNFCAHNYTP